MIEHSINFIQNVILPFGSLGIFFAEIIEEVIVPIPSAMILLASGFIFLKGKLTLALISTLVFKVAIPAALGLTAGSTFIYYLSYRFENFFIEKFGFLLGIKQKDLDLFNKKLNGGIYDEVLIVFFRIVPIVPSVLLAVFCGVVKMPILKYIKLTFIGAFFRSAILAFIGFQVGEIYIKYASIISRFENKILLLVVAGLVSYSLYRFFHRKVV